jgi:hypothetical protein
MCWKKIFYARSLQLLLDMKRSNLLDKKLAIIPYKWRNI